MRGQTETHSGCQLLSLRYGTIYDTEGDIIKWRKDSHRHSNRDFPSRKWKENNEGDAGIE